MPINVERVKYLVAREGLVIVACIVISFVFGYIDNYKNKKKIEYNNNISIPYDLFKFTKEDSTGRYYEKLSKTVIFPKNTDNTVRDNTIIRDYGENVEIIIYDDSPGKDIFDKISPSNVVARYNSKGEKVFNWYFWKTNTNFMFLAFFAYPIYLLGRFVIWSVRTIRKYVQSNSL